MRDAPSDTLQSRVQLEPLPLRWVLSTEKKGSMISTVFVHLISSLVQRPSHSQVLDHLQCTKILYEIQLKQDGEKKVRQPKKL